MYWEQSPSQSMPRYDIGCAFVLLSPEVTKSAQRYTVGLCREGGRQR